MEKARVPEKLQEEKAGNQEKSLGEIPSTIKKIVEHMYQQTEILHDLMNQLNTIKHIIDEGMGLDPEMIALEEKQPELVEKPINFLMALTDLKSQSTDNLDRIQEIFQVVIQLRNFLQTQFKP